MHKNKLYPGWAEASGELPIQGLSERERTQHIRRVESLSKENLAKFTNTGTLYQVALFNRTGCTEGAKFVADTAGAWWLLDIIVSYQFNAKVKPAKFQVWDLTVWEDRTATLECKDDTGHLIISHEIADCDFPIPEITLWFSHQPQQLPTILLPSES